MMNENQEERPATLDEVQEKLDADFREMCANAAKVDKTNYSRQPVYEPAENIAKQWLQAFMSQYEKDNHTRLNYTIFDRAFVDAAVLSLYLDDHAMRAHVSVDIGNMWGSTINWASGSTTTTVDIAIATRDLMNVAIEVALAWSAHCEEMGAAKS